MNIMQLYTGVSCSFMLHDYKAKKFKFSNLSFKRMYSLPLFVLYRIASNGFQDILVTIITKVSAISYIIAIHIAVRVH